MYMVLIQPLRCFSMDFTKDALLEAIFLIINEDPSKFLGCPNKVVSFIAKRLVEIKGEENGSSDCD